MSEGQTVLIAKTGRLLLEVSLSNLFIKKEENERKKKGAESLRKGNSQVVNFQT